jgi:thiamine-phosphate pyrophosphorylase
MTNQMRESPGTNRRVPTSLLGEGRSVANLDPGRLAVYVVTSTAFANRSHPDVAEGAIAGGATALQLRAPELDDATLQRVAADIARRCRSAGVLFIVNDRADVAAEVGADGVHVGQRDDPRLARQVLGSERVLGVSVGSPEEALDAELLGADYLGVTVWPTPTKPEADAVGLDGLSKIAGGARLPVVGIGGIGVANAGTVIDAGAVGIAVISAVAGADDPTASTAALRDAVDTALRRREVTA